MNFQFSKTQDRSWFYITCTVVVIHFLCIGWAVFSQAQMFFKSQKPSQRLVIQTIALNSDPIPKQSFLHTPIQSPSPENKPKLPPDPILPKSLLSKPPPKQPSPAPAAVHKPTSTVNSPIKQSTKTSNSKEPSKPRESPKPKEETKSNTIPKSIKKAPNQLAIKQDQEEQKKTETQLAEAQRQQKLMAEVQERIAKISGSRDKISSETNNNMLKRVPPVITSLEIDNLSAPKETLLMSQYEKSYRDELAARLKLLLRLPEYGDVKVDLTLNRSGKVNKIKIISAESALNRKYIEKTLPELSFPAFGDNFAIASEYTFSITLSNEI
jgi:colicin import membrane protein